MKTRAFDWLDTEKLKTVYGIQVFYDGRWMHLSENGEPCFFYDKEEREAKRKQLRKITSFEDFYVTTATSKGKRNA